MVQKLCLTGVLAGLFLMTSGMPLSQACSMTPLPTPDLTSDLTPDLTSDRTYISSSDLDSLTITFERLGCFGFCPIYRLQIRGSGEVEYDGQEHVAIEGQRTYQLSEQAVQSLLDAFDRAHFWSLADRYEGGYTDAPATIITLTQAGTTKEIFHYSASPDAPQALTELEQQIDAIALPR